MIAENTDRKYSIKYFEDCTASQSPSRNMLDNIQSVVETLKNKGNTWSDNRSYRSQQPRPSPLTSSSGSSSGTKPLGGGSAMRMPTATTNSSSGVSYANAANSASAQKAPVTTILGNVTTGFDSQLLLIRTYLNKTTDKTKSDMYVKITNILSQIIHPDMVPENMVRLSEAIYEISSANKFYSKLFAGMYVDLVREYPKLAFTLNAKMQRFTDLSMFDAIAINTDATSYEQSCKNNKNNDMLKAETTFLGHILTITEKQDNVAAVLMSLLNRIDASKMDAAAKNNNHELVEYVYILFKLLNGAHTDIHAKVLALSKCKAKECLGLASKLIFKCMEMMEMKIVNKKETIFFENAKIL
jgi:hypothetical protein